MSSAGNGVIVQMALNDLQKLRPAMCAEICFAVGFCKIYHLIVASQIT